MSEKTYLPVFVGKTSEGEKISVYKHRILENHLHILLSDGKLYALGPDTEIITRFEIDTQLFHIYIKSAVWTGFAKGSHYDLVSAEGLE